MRKGIAIGALAAFILLALMGSRTYTELIASFPDNHARLITPADMRELVDSLQVKFGKARITAVATTAIAAQDTWYPITGTWGSCPESRETSFDFTANTGRVCNDTGMTQMYTVSLAVSLEAVGSNNQTFRAGLLTDADVFLECLDLYGESRFGGIYQSVSGVTSYKLNHSECLRPAIMNTTGTADFSVATALIRIQSMPPAVGP